MRVGYDTKWEVKLKTPEASSKAHHRLQSNRKASRTVKDVLIGQVWLCSGQSNMNWSAANGIVDMKQELTGKAEPADPPLHRHEKQFAYPSEDCVRTLGGVRCRVRCTSALWGISSANGSPKSSVNRRTGQLVVGRDTGRGVDAGLRHEEEPADGRRLEENTPNTAAAGILVRSTMR